MSPENAEQHSSKESSSPNASPGETETSSESQNIQSVLGFIRKYPERETFDGSQPLSLRSSTDRPGRDGTRDRLQRRRRLVEAIHLSSEQLGYLLRYIWDHETSEGIQWDLEILYTYVPRTFETATVLEATASDALEDAICKSLFKHFPR